MNIIFLDFDGVINTKHFTTKDEIEFKIKIVAERILKLKEKKVVEEMVHSGEYRRRDHQVHSPKHRPHHGKENISFNLSFVVQACRGDISTDGGSSEAFVPESLPYGIDRVSSAEGCVYTHGQKDQNQYCSKSFIHH